MDTTARYSDEQLLDDLRLCAAALGHSPSPAEWRSGRPQGAASFGTYFARFGSWGEVLRRAGLAPHTRRAQPTRRPGPLYSRAELIAQLQQVARTLGKSPSTGRWVRLCQTDTGLACHSTIISCFGSWNAALAAAGLPRNRVATYSSAELLETLRAELAVQSELSAEAWERCRGTRPRAATYARRFESFAEAKRRAITLDTPALTEAR